MINSTYIDGNFQDFSGNISKINNNNNSTLISELGGHYLYRKFQTTPDSTDFSNSSSIMLCTIKLIVLFKNKIHLPKVNVKRSDTAREAR
jgi:hypothetical protein